MASEWHIEETYKGLIILSVEALKTLALVNGGAAVALLTYAGSLVSRAPDSHAPHLRVALLSYCGGLLATVLAFIVAYWTQLRLYEEERKRHEGQSFQQRHPLGIWIAGTLAFFAAVAFSLGCWYAASALKKSGAL